MMGAALVHAGFAEVIPDLLHLPDGTMAGPVLNRDLQVQAVQVEGNVCY